MRFFFQGCPHHCKGCHNISTWDMDGGYLCEIGKIVEEIRANPLLRGITYSGGEPFMQVDAMLSINEALSDIVDCNFDYMAYTGFTYEELQEQAINDPKIDKVLGQLDYLVDGKFIDEEKDLTCMFRGSRNQRFIDLRATRESGIIIEKNFSD